MWYGGHGESNAGISYMRGPNGEPGPAVSIMMADKYSDIDIDRGDDIVYCGSNRLDNTSSNTPADGEAPVRGNAETSPSIIMADKYGDIDVDRGDDIVYCGSNSLDNTSSNTPADGGPPVRGNAALFKPTEKKTRLVRICFKNPERRAGPGLLEYQNNKDARSSIVRRAMPSPASGRDFRLKIRHQEKAGDHQRFPPEGQSGEHHRFFTSPVRDISAYLLFSNDSTSRTPSTHTSISARMRKSLLLECLTVGGYLEDLPDLQDLNAHLGDPYADLGDPSSFASTGAEQSIEFHTSFEGMPPNGPADQGLGPTALPEIEQANDSNDLDFKTELQTLLLLSPMGPPLATPPCGYFTL
ncbi:YDG/SRA domain-containing protein [Colletotrichum nymphaeae SA-01]|uniref:YDG/SRA domain-containing protein n=1 Tax=Colletotrichum nymphaeae SA-01 TaxID=1460502 RepID=A0A135TVS2_9PEZI|nr:YDG/SRA domain-containing protein [Colletotrichum nymphaeae SA-01]